MFQFVLSYLSTISYDNKFLYSNIFFIQTLRGNEGSTRTKRSKWNNMWTDGVYDMWLEIKSFLFSKKFCLIEFLNILHFHLEDYNRKKNFWRFFFGLH